VIDNIVVIDNTVGYRRPGEIKRNSDPNTTIKRRIFRMVFLCGFDIGIPESRGNDSSKTDSILGFRILPNGGTRTGCHWIAYGSGD
jgi:hypothetical protein